LFLKPPSERPSGFLVVPNLVRGLVPSAPDQIWVADITYVHLAGAFAYLAVILDAFSLKAVGWAFDDTLDTSLAMTALAKTIAARRATRGSLIHYSDRDVQYASVAYRQRLADRDIILSMSRPGNPFDNAESTTRSASIRRLDISRPLSSKPRSRKTNHGNASWQPHCHCNYRVSLKGAVQWI
jgi:transposase InsO family protein